MITGDVKEGRYDAGRLQEAQAAEVTIARELPVISEEHTSAYSKMPKEKAKEEPAALMVVERLRLTFVLVWNIHRGINTAIKRGGLWACHWS